MESRNRFVNTLLATDFNRISPAVKAIVMKNILESSGFTTAVIRMDKPVDYYEMSVIPDDTNRPNELLGHLKLICNPEVVVKKPLVLKSSESLIEE